MTPPAYSKRFYAGNATTRPYSGSVPTGRIWVVRSMDCVYNSATQNAIAVFIAPINAYFWRAMVGGAETWAHWDGRQVLNAGESLGIIGYTGMMLVVSGYELEA